MSAECLARTRAGSCRNIVRCKLHRCSPFGRQRALVRKVCEHTDSASAAREHSIGTLNPTNISVRQQSMPQVDSKALCSTRSALNTGLGCAPKPCCVSEGALAPGRLACLDACAPHMPHITPIIHRCVCRTVVPALLRQTGHRLRRALARHLRVDVLVGNADEHKPKRGPRDIPRSEDKLRQRSKAWQGACRQSPQVSERGSSGTVERRCK